jgi:hypothetical protein
LVWDTIADIGFIGYDIYKLATEGGGQGNENWKALGLDGAAAAIPFATGAGVAYRAERAAARALEARSAINQLEHGIQLAKQEQAAQLAAGKGIPIAGAGTDKALREAGRLSETYGGKPGDWSKVTSGHYKAADGTKVETHAYQNTKTGEVVEMKDKFPRDK